MRRIAPIGLVLLVLLANLAGIAQRPATAATPPNFVVILTDDQNRDTLGRTQDGAPFMPVLDEALIGQGTTFPNTVITTPVCCPSRSTLLTGKYAHNTGVKFNGNAIGGGWKAFRDNDGEEDNLFIWLDGAGYHTGLVGKYLNGYPMGRPNPPGVDVGFITNSSSDDGYRSGAWEATRDGRKVKGRGYRTNALTDEAVAFIEEAPAGQPFFLWLAHKAPHTPYDPATNHQKAFAGERVPRTAGWNEADVSDKPGWARAKRLDRKTQKRLDKEWRASLAMMRSVDDGIDDLMTALEDTGRLDNTYVVYLTDNGYLFGQHRLQGKGLLYEEAVNFPLIVRGPGFAAGAEDDRLVATTDLAPTILDLAGLPADPDADGRSLRATGDRAVVLMETWSERRDKNRANQLGLRGPSWSYIESKGAPQFYDLTSDPEQVENAWGWLSPETQGRLADRVAAMKSCAGNACRHLENAALAIE